MNKDLQSIIEAEMVTFSGQTFSDSDQVQDYIREMMERIAGRAREMERTRCAEIARGKKHVCDSWCPDPNNCGLVSDTREDIATAIESNPINPLS